MKHLLLIALVALTGCSKLATEPQDKPRPLAQAIPASQAHAYPEGSLTVLSVPVNSNSKYTEHQTCFVWRDKEFKTASLQCPNDRQSYSIDPP